MKIHLQKISVIVLFTLLTIITSTAQEAIDPVYWSFSIEENGSDTVLVVATASIDEPWHVYSLLVSNDPEAMGPMPLEFVLETTDDYKVIGDPEEFSQVITHHDVNFDMELNFFEKELVVKQKVKVYSRDISIIGSITFMACDDEQCIYPAAIPFEVRLNKD